MKQILKVLLGVALLIMLIIVGGVLFFKKDTATKDISEPSRSSHTIESSSVKKSSSHSSMRNSSTNNTEMPKVNENSKTENEQLPQTAVPSEAPQDSNSVAAEQPKQSPTTPTPSSGAPAGVENGGSAQVSNGKLELDKAVPVYATPDKTTKVVYTYPAGSVYFENYFNENGEWWYSYVSYDGTKYYIAYSDVGH